MFKVMWKLVKKEKENILLVFYALLFFVIVGFVFPEASVEIKKQVLEKVLSQIEGKGLFEIIAFIIWNNTKAAFMAVLFGAVFFPVIGVVFNGYFIGAVFRDAVAKDGVFIIWKIFPHGIFEIPALCIAFWFGLRVGLRKGGYKKAFKEGMLVWMYIVVPLLIVAGVIEGVLFYLMGGGA